MKRSGIILILLSLVLVLVTALPVLAQSTDETSDVVGEISSVVGEESSLLPEGSSALPEEESSEFGGEPGSEEESSDFSEFPSDEISGEEENSGEEFSGEEENSGEEISGEEESSEEGSMPEISYAPSYVYRLIVKAGEGGRVNSSVNGSYDAGERIDLSAEPNEGYQFSRWKSSGGVIANAFSQDTEFYMPVGDVTVEAVFEKIPEEESSVTEEESVSEEESSAPVKKEFRMPYKLLYSLIGLGVFAVLLAGLLTFIYYRKKNPQD